MHEEMYLMNTGINTAGNLEKTSYLNHISPISR